MTQIDDPNKKKNIYYRNKTQPITIDTHMLQDTLNELNPTYSILDAARIFGELNTAQKLQSNFLSLYKGRSEELLTTVAPYLFPYKNSSEFGNWLMDRGWGNAWGIFIVSKSTMEELHKHFRKFLMVQTEQGQELYFRFYDPRVLRIFLPTCDTTQLRDFFGPIQSFIVEDVDPNRLLIFSFDGGQLKTKIIENVAENKKVGDDGVVITLPNATLYNPIIPTPEQQILTIQRELKGKIDIPNPFAAQPKIDEQFAENEVNRQVNKVKPNTSNIPNEQSLDAKLGSEVNKVKPNTTINTPNVNEKSLESKVKREIYDGRIDTGKVDEMDRLANNANPEKQGKMLVDEAKLKSEQQAREQALKPIKKTKFNPLD